jgi:hypothetical protein
VRSLCSRFPVDTQSTEQSVCDQSVIDALSLCDRHRLTAQLFCNRFEIAFKLLRSLYAINVQSLCNIFAINFQSLLKRFTIIELSFRNRCAIYTHRCALIAQLLWSHLVIDLQSLCSRYPITARSLRCLLAIILQLPLKCCATIAQLLRNGYTIAL